MTGIIFDIKRFAINDGPGIRTTVFLKGCPLSCLWCHNPESQRSGPELLFAPEKCAGCGRCAEACPAGCVAPAGFDRAGCTGCGRCAEVCPAGARELAGRRVSVETVLETVAKDRAFYRETGGMTLSGGEPLFQPEFTLALLRGAKRAGFHTCLDTSGFASREVVDQLPGAADLVLYDLKESDPVRHREYTGVPLEPILANLARIDAAGMELVLRCPLIPKLNRRMEHADAIARIAGTLRHLRRIDLMAYHPLGESKSKRLGRAPAFQDAFAAREELEPFRQRLQSGVPVPVNFS